MQITFDFVGKRIVLDGAEKELLTLIEAVRELAPILPQLTVNTIIGAVDSTPPPPPPATPGDAGEGQAAQRRRLAERSTMRDFVRSLIPKTHSEKIAGIAHFVKEHEGKPTFTPKEMDAWYTACGFTKPSQFPVALSDAKKGRFVTNASWGQWKIDRDGENWVINRMENPTINGSESSKE